MTEFKKLSYPEYEELAKPLLKELARMARWLAETGQRIVVIFEGRDTAGKGGSIGISGGACAAGQLSRFASAWRLSAFSKLSP